jgi:hypothetical protein
MVHWQLLQGMKEEHPLQTDDTWHIKPFDIIKSIQGRGVPFMDEMTLGPYGHMWQRKDKDTEERFRWKCLEQPSYVLLPRNNNL